MARIQLAHFVEGVGEHYLCVEGYVQSYEENIIIVMSKNTAKRVISLFMIMMIKSRETISQTHQENNKLRKKNKRHAIL